MNYVVVALRPDERVAATTYEDCTQYVHRKEKKKEKKRTSKLHRLSSIYYLLRARRSRKGSARWFGGVTEDSFLREDSALSYH